MRQSAQSEGVGRVRETGAAMRAVDIVLAAALLLVLAPVIVVLAVLSRLDGGPAFCGEFRIGRRGQPFRRLKFRTTGAGGTTSVGRFLRATNLDGLPWLFNVLRGDVSLSERRLNRRRAAEPRLDRLSRFG